MLVPDLAKLTLQNLSCQHQEITVSSNLAITGDSPPACPATAQSILWNCILQLVSQTT